MSFCHEHTDRFYQPVVTVLVYLAYRRFPHTWIRFINVPIFFNAAGNIPPANTSKPARTPTKSELPLTPNSSILPLVHLRLHLQLPDQKKSFRLVEALQL